MTHSIGKNAKGTHVMCMVETADCYKVFMLTCREELVALLQKRWPGLPEVQAAVLATIDNETWNNYRVYAQGLIFYDVLCEGPDTSVPCMDIVRSLERIAVSLETIAHREYSGEVVGS